jgi:hypothetical protein
VLELLEAAGVTSCLALPSRSLRHPRMGGTVSMVSRGKNYEALRLRMIRRMPRKNGIESHYNAMKGEDDEEE